jgi:hypothetical protein
LARGLGIASLTLAASYIFLMSTEAGLTPSPWYVLVIPAFLLLFVGFTLLWMGQKNAGAVERLQSHRQKIEAAASLIQAAALITHDPIAAERIVEQTFSMIRDSTLAHFSQQRSAGERG